MLELLQDVSYRFSRPLWTQRLRSYVEPDDTLLMKLGTPRAGWMLPESAVRAGGVAICAGAGEDISFDVELNKRGFQVYTLDPTPRSRRHAARVVRASQENAAVPIDRFQQSYDLRGFDQRRFRFEDVGVWSDDVTMRFFAPRNPDHVSHSIVNLQRTISGGFEARCLTLETFCRMRGIHHIDILKLDIEGSEYAVIGSLIESRLRPAVLCIDFDEMRVPLDGHRKERILGALELLGRHGYRFRHLEKTRALLVLTAPSYSVAEIAD